MSEQMLELIAHLEQVEVCFNQLVKQNRKLKLERLMYKADSQAWYYTDLGFSSKASRWHNLYEACRKELEK
jgi:hypothetical protein